MNACPACSQPVGPNDVTCPKCGISLHPGTATAGPAGGSGKGMSVVAIVVIVIIGVVLLVGCLGLVGASLIFGLRSSARMPAATPTAAPLPPITESVEVQESGQSVPLQVDPKNGPPSQAPSEQNTPDERSDKP
jgi:hypothetical protein